MKKYFRLTMLSAVVTTASVLLASAAFAGGNGHHNGNGHNGNGHNGNGHNGDYKGDYKDEAPMPAPVCVQDRCLRDGFYVGLGVSYDSYRIRHSQTYNLTGTFVTRNPIMNATGWDASIFAGYGQYWDWFYLAGEIMASTSNANADWGSGADLFPAIPGITVTLDHEIRARTSYGIAVLPGMKVNPSTLLYIRLGWMRTNFKVDEDVTVVGVPFSFSESEWENGFQYGFGMETAVCDNWSLRGEYTHTRYSSFRNNETAIFNSKLSPANNQYVLSVIYHIV